jgi:enamine deaminase RidA (YjgF/YER057c/UK114 family)
MGGRFAARRIVSSSRSLHYKAARLDPSHCVQQSDVWIRVSIESRNPPFSSPLPDCLAEAVEIYSSLIMANKTQNSTSPKAKSRSRRALFQVTALTLLGAETAHSQTSSAWSPKKDSTNGPIRSGHLLFLSGIGGWYPERRPKAGDVREQTADALKIMKESLEKAGSSMENVLKVQVALVDPEKNWEPMNEAYNTFFPKNRPARSYFGSTGFRRPGQLLQIDCIAYVD